jgi:acetamidase/formamidase
MALHRFEPKVYRNTIGTYEPVLTIASGDTVITTTVDARGVDAAGRRVAEGPNPQTGPFLVKGAQPGDMLSVHFDRLRPNRRHGWSATVIAPNVLDPDYVKQTPEPEFSQWDIDLEAGTATLIQPEVAFGHISLPLEPMLGCFGVAPPMGQAISTATSSTHGGNMDYRGFVQGVTVHFPVFVPGALFHLGDGHALQGDGEIVGTGIEISFDVQFTVRLVEGKTIQWPRAENESYIMTVGNARPLDQCVQHATTEMVRWLEKDYRLDKRGVHLFLGQCARYEMGNIFDPAYTMVCKMSKKLLDQIGPARQTAV